MLKQRMPARLVLLKMDDNEFEENDNDEDQQPLSPRRRFRVVARKKLRVLAYRLRAAGLTAAELLFLEQEEAGLVLLALFSFCEWSTTNFLDEYQQHAQIIYIFHEFLKLVQMRMPVVLSCDLPTGIELKIERLDDGWCWNAFRFRKSGLEEMFRNSRLALLISNMLSRLRC
jgi:hypothetical protein